MKYLGTRSRGNMEGIDFKLSLVVGMALARGKVDFTIIDGLRTAEEQYEHFLSGASQKDGTKKISGHQLANAIDFIPFPFISWSESKSFRDIWNELNYCAKHLGFKVEPHISWDGGHFEILG